MLQINPFSPPAPFRPVAPAGRTEGSHTGPGRPFISAEDFDATGILAGVDPCESRYWWMPELYGPESAAGRDQATRRTASRATAAA